MMRRFGKLTRGFRRRLAVTTLTGLLRVLADLAFVALSKQAVDIATGNTNGRLSVCVVALVVALLVQMICSAVGNRSAELSEAAMKNALQDKLFSRLLSTVWTGRESFHSGDMLTRLTEDCRIVAESLCRTVPTMFVAAFQLLAAFAFLWHFSPALAMLLFLLLPLFMLAGKVFFRKVRRYTKRIREIESRLHSRMQESLQHRILLLAYGQAGRVIKAIGRLHQSRYNYVRRRTDVTVYSRTAVLAGFEASYLAAFLWGIVGLRRGTVSFGLMTAYLQLAGQIQRPIAELARLLPGFIHSQAAFSRLEAIEDLPVEEDCEEYAQPVSATTQGICFRDVSFTYPGKDKPVMERFSHTFLPGSRTAIMGETGAGKSTLLRLILALLRQQEGRIDLFDVDDGKGDCMPVSVATRSRIVYVPQGNSLLSGTIRQNLRLGKPDATDDEMYAALHAAAADFVSDLERGLDTECGEHGDGLSEGQAQRIAIARGLLRSGSILLLDEISASLDEATELLLMKRLTEYRHSHTLLLVTHRSAAAAYCDTILRIGKQ